MKTIFIILILATGAFGQSDLLTVDGLRNQKKATTEPTTSYDKFRDHTLVKAPEIDLIPAGHFFDEVQLYVGFGYDGKVLPKFTNVFYFTFIVTASDWRYLNSGSRQMIILADNVRISRVDKDHTGRVSTAAKQVRTREILSFSLTANDLLIIASAESVEMQLGSLETTFTEKDKTIILNLLNASIKP